MNRRNFLTLSAGAAAGMLLGKEATAASIKSSLSSTFGLVALTFDDGYISIYDTARRIMGKGIPGTNCLVPSWLGIGDSQQQAWNQVWELYNEYNWEIANHTISHADLTKLSAEDVVKAVTDAEDAFMQNGIVTNRALIPPYGAFDGPVVAALRESGVVSSLRRAWAHRDGLNYPATFDPWAIEAYYVSNRTTFADLKKMIDKAVAHNGLLVLVIHRVMSTPAEDYDMSAKVLQDVCYYIGYLAKRNQASAVTLSQGVARMMQAQSLL